MGLVCFNSQSVRQTLLAEYALRVFFFKSTPYQINFVILFQTLRRHTYQISTHPGPCFYLPSSVPVPNAPVIPALVDVVHRA